MIDNLDFRKITLCAASSVNIDQTISAINHCASFFYFSKAILFTDVLIEEKSELLEVIYIPKMRSGAEYSEFIINSLPDYIDTEFVLVVQWDGFIFHPEMWSPQFLSYDYIGAIWPQFTDGACVGNGGFSLRSKRLLHACRDPQFMFRHPEDVAICRDNRALLENKHGICFAPAQIAERFSFERSLPSGPTFGFHGAFNMIDVMGASAFWDAYPTLDDRSSVFVDYGHVVRATLRHGAKMGWLRAARTLLKFTVDHIRHKFQNGLLHRSA